MPFESKTRFNELETEHHEEPDDEHTQVAISNGDWSLTVYVSGLMELGAIGWITGSPNDVPVPSLYLRVDSRDLAVQLLTLMAEGRVEELKAAPWTRHEDLSPHERDLFGPTPLDEAVHAAPRGGVRT